jgi:hypothetical protein
LGAPDLSQGRKMSLPSKQISSLGFFVSTIALPGKKLVTIGDISFWVASLPGQGLSKIRVFRDILPETEQKIYWIWQVPQLIVPLLPIINIAVTE